MLLMSFTASAASIDFTSVNTDPAQDFLSSETDTASETMTETNKRVSYQRSVADNTVDLDGVWTLWADTQYKISTTLTVLIDPSTGVDSATLVGGGESINLNFLSTTGISDQKEASFFVELVGGVVYTLTIDGTVDLDGDPEYATVAFKSAGLTETPLPAAAWLFGSVLLGGAAWRKRKQAKAA